MHSDPSNAYHDLGLAIITGIGLVSGACTWHTWPRIEVEDFLPTWTSNCENVWLEDCWTSLGHMKHGLGIKLEEKGLVLGEDDQRNVAGSPIYQKVATCMFCQS